MADNSVTRWLPFPLAILSQFVVLASGSTASVKSFRLSELGLGLQLVYSLLVPAKLMMRTSGRVQNLTT